MKYFTPRDAVRLHYKLIVALHKILYENEEYKIINTYLLIASENLRFS